MCFYQNFKVVLIILVNFIITVGKLVQNMNGVGQMFTAEKMKVYARKKHYHVVDHEIMLNTKSFIINPCIANVPDLYPLREPGKFWFSVVFSGYTYGT